MLAGNGGEGRTQMFTEPLTGLVILMRMVVGYLDDLGCDVRNASDL